eukprot:CAMPEP_0118876876 /NCGR_PEP_ID=MMETSP1163-20130328/17391_1 /TAXON_ID=124430 /ORGANISM="Phaeomonas parva, Strain CCMP2877" /LENGTH=81 /DNA_ID=CAMNT_0006812527 /DNA_START=213 /DNA_END=455 /DNA_ORIENTATION=+
MSSFSQLLDATRVVVIDIPVIIISILFFGFVFVGAGEVLFAVAVVLVVIGEPAQGGESVELSLREQAVSVGVRDVEDAGED